MPKVHSDGGEASTRHVLRAAVRPRVASVVSSRFVCATLDWWPSDKCDYGRCPWGGASLLDVDLEDPLLLAAARSGDSNAHHLSIARPEPTDRAFASRSDQC